jgi:4-diphosphocytidyl-2-C-methyl-D-erythritol kinase
MRLFAQAKINWTLEVLGRRRDGYHEVSTVLQTVSTGDLLEIEPAEELRLEVTGEHEASEDDLVLRAARALDDGKGRGATIRLAKMVPVAAGLGGGSSDAAATLRGLNELWALGRRDEELADIAAGLGSDVPFFLTGGTALAESRGERVTSLPDAPPRWLVLVVPRLRLEEKTKRMYEALRPEHYGDGTRSRVLAERVKRGRGVREEHLHNAFDDVAYDVFEGLDAYREALLAAGAGGVHVAGAGPALFALAAGRTDQREIFQRLAMPWTGGAASMLVTVSRADSLLTEG